MRCDQGGSSIYYVKQCRNGRWKVTANKYERPLAFFERIEHAKNYADKIADDRKDSSVLIEK